jgi:hypothetical protein
VRVDEPANLDDIDTSVADQASKRADFARYRGEELQLVEWIESGTHPMKPGLHNIDARISETLRGTAALGRKHDGHPHAVSIKPSCEHECLVMWTAKDGIVDHEDNVHAAFAGPSL